MNGQGALLKEKAPLFSRCAEINSDFRGLFSSVLPAINMESQVECSRDEFLDRSGWEPTLGKIFFKIVQNVHKESQRYSVDRS